MAIQLIDSIDDLKFKTFLNNFDIGNITGTISIASLELKANKIEVLNTYNEILYTDSATAITDASSGTGAYRYIYVYKDSGVYVCKLRDEVPTYSSIKGGWYSGTMKAIYRGYYSGTDLVSISKYSQPYNKDTQNTFLKSWLGTNSIEEKNIDAGVGIEGVVLKDGKVKRTYFQRTTSTGSVTKTQNEWFNLLKDYVPDVDGRSPCRTFHYRSFVSGPDTFHVYGYGWQLLRKDTVKVEIWGRLYVIRNSSFFSDDYGLVHELNSGSATTLGLGFLLA